LFRDEIPVAKLIVGGQEYITGPKSKIKLETVRPSAGNPVLMIGLEVSNDPILFQKLVNAAEQRSLKMQIRGKEFNTELATKTSSPGPEYKGRIVLRQCSKMQDVK
jgi:hypothetical protein